MRKLGLAAALAATIAVTGCAEYPGEYGYDPYYGHGQYQNGYYNNGYANNGYYGQDGYWHPYNNGQGASVATGAAIGAVGGALVTRSVGGAIAGAVLGGVLGAVVNGHQYYRDTRGYCYFVDQYGNPHYSYDIRC